MAKDPRQVYRGLLKILKTPPLPKELARKIPPADIGGPPKMNAPMRFVAQSFHRHPKNDAGLSSQTNANNNNSNDSILLAKSLDVAHEYLKLLEDLKARGQLYELDAGADVVLTPKELSRRAAARAGLQLPKLHDN